MQGKEVSEQETLDSTAGIDVSKLWLDVHVLPSSECLRVANDAAGIRRLKRWLLRRTIRLVVVEATGKWHRELSRSLSASGIPVAIIDPYRARMFARAQRIIAKTDRLDAKVLALFGVTMDPACRPLAPECIELMKELITARASAVDEHIALRNQLSAATSAFLKRQLARRIDQLARHISALERECLNQIQHDPELARRYRILTSIPGIALVVAVTLIAGLSEIGTLTGKQVASLAGLAPVADESGQRQGARVIWGGRRAVRRALYQAALSASRHNTALAAFHRRLIESGKAPKAALIAVARKLVVLANTLVAENRNWQAQAPQHA